VKDTTEGAGTPGVPALSFDPAVALAEERAKVEAALAALYAGFTPTDGLGFGKRIGDGTHVAVERIVDVGKQEVLLEKLRAIGEAEEELAAGTYGLCRECGEPIPLERLEVRPYATRCVRHA